MIRRIRENLLILCRGDSEQIINILDEPGYKWFYLCSVAIILGCGLYGSSIGFWRGGLQALFSALKFPLLIFLTTFGNALLNWMLSLVIGLPLSFRQTHLALLMSYALAALILGSLTPVSYFVIYNSPLASQESNILGHSFITLFNVMIIAWAGILATSRLYNFIKVKSPSRGTAIKVIFAWLAGNMFLGCQLSWNLRPFIGSPLLETEFLRPNPMQGNFYIDVYKKIMHMFF